MCQKDNLLATEEQKTGKVTNMSSTLRENSSPGGGLRLASKPNLFSFNENQTVKQINEQKLKTYKF